MPSTTTQKPPLKPLLNYFVSAQGALVQPICANLVEQQMQWDVWQTKASDNMDSFDTFTQKCAKEVVSTAVMKLAMRKQADLILKGVPLQHAVNCNVS